MCVYAQNVKWVSPASAPCLSLPVLYELSLQKRTVESSDKRVLHPERDGRVLSYTSSLSRKGPSSPVIYELSLQNRTGVSWTSVSLMVVSRHPSPFTPLALPYRFPTPARTVASNAHSQGTVEAHTPHSSSPTPLIRRVQHPRSSSPTLPLGSSRPRLILR